MGTNTDEVKKMLHYKSVFFLKTGRPKPAKLLQTHLL